MGTTEARLREVDDDLERLLRRRRPPPSRRLREAVSLAVWVLTASLGWVAARAAAVVGGPRQAGTRAAGTVTRPRPAVAGSAARSSPFARWTVHAAVLVLVGVPVAGEGLKVAAGPLRPTLQALERRSTVLAADGSTMAVVHDGVNRREVPLADVPQLVRDAVIAAEDQRFRTHGGFDAEAIGRAAMANLRAGAVTQGASTITQQLAKQNHVGDSATFLRKGKELVYALALEERFSKDQLLERYLNQVYFGAQAYGVAAAAEEFFGVALAELTLEQAALLAGLIRAPAALDPRTAPGAARARRGEVLAAMVGLGTVTAEEADAAGAAPLGVIPHRPPTNIEPAVLEAVKREFLANPAFGQTEADRRRLLQTGGLTIKATVDPRLQVAARTAARWVPERLGAAVVAVDPRSGRIAALSTSGAAAAGQFDVATQGGRQPGSTFKPLVAAAALEAGMPEWQALVGDGPIEIDYERGLPPWRVDNYDGEDYGLIGVREAVVNSVNTAFAQLGVALGADRMAAMAERLGIDPVRSLGPPESRGPSMALGGLTHGVSPLQLASAYSAFAANGTRTPPYVIEEVVGPDGASLYRAAPAPEVALDPAVNAALVDILVDAVEEGTGAGASLPGWDVLGKTGTTEDSADAWFVGAVPTLSTAVWIGHPDRREPVRGLTGGAMAAPVWRAFMTAALRGQQPVAFEDPTVERPRTAPLRLPVARPCWAPECLEDSP
ncbi:MAG: transglycosylase domain-containing protein [Acidimicrobiia bacterium]